MMEAYAEWLVKRKTPAYYLILKPIMIIVCVVSVLVAFMTVYGMLVLLAAAAATYFVFRNANIEYEYIYVTGQLSFDKIMGQAKRKTVKNVEMEAVQIIAPSDAYQLKDHIREGTKSLDLSSGNVDAKTYTLITQSGGESIKIIFEPNGKMLQCLRQAAPRKVIL